MGTSSLHAFFACAGYRAVHFQCKLGVTCAECMRQSVEEGRASPFAKCGKATAEAYSQIDDGSHGHFPQVEFLHDIVRAFSESGTFLMTFRGMEEWYHSLTHWPPENDANRGPHMSDGLRDADIPGFPSGRGRNVEEFRRWHCDHVRRVRAVVARNPNQTLVEIDIEDPSVGSYLADVFDVDERCWGRRNVNARLHPEHDATRAATELPWCVGGRTCVRGKTRMRPRRTEQLPLLPDMPPWLLTINDTCSSQTASQWESRQWDSPQRCHRSS